MPIMPTNATASLYLLSPTVAEDSTAEWHGGSVHRMRDADIRQALLAKVKTLHSADPDTLIVNELGLRQGAVRVDLAVVNGVLHGYEIKSLADTLRRLPEQVRVYGQVLDFATIVLAQEHRRDATALLPRWWGVVVARPEGDEISLREIRRARRNPAVEKRALAELLWHQETLHILRERGAAAGLGRKPRAEAWNRLCEVCSLDEIGRAVRESIKDRRDRSVDQ